MQELHTAKGKIQKDCTPRIFWALCWVREDSSARYQELWKENMEHSAVQTAGCSKSGWVESHGCTEQAPAQQLLPIRQITNSSGQFGSILSSIFVLST